MTTDISFGEPSAKSFVWPWVCVWGGAEGGKPPEYFTESVREGEGGCELLQRYSPGSQ